MLCLLFLGQPKPFESRRNCETEESNEMKPFRRFLIGLGIGRLLACWGQHGKGKVGNSLAIVPQRTEPTTILKKGAIRRRTGSRAQWRNSAGDCHHCRSSKSAAPHRSMKGKERLLLSWGVCGLWLS